MTVRSARTYPRRAVLAARTWRSASTYFVLIFVAILVGLPVLWFLISSFKTESEYIAYPIKFVPTTWQWQNYIFAVTFIPFWRYAWHSLYLSVMYSTLCVITSAMAGFAFSRIKVPGRDALFAVVLAMLIIPGLVTTIPQFIVFSRVKLTNTYWPWVLWGLAAAPFHIFLFRQFFTTIPEQLEEAAEVDGCTPYRVLWQIFLPNAKPVLATSFIFNFSGTWGDWFGALIYLDNTRTTLAVKLTEGYANPQGLPMTMPSLAAAAIYTVPLIVLFFLGQKYIIQGVVTSGIKG